jgi:hypothetical protein
MSRVGAITPQVFRPFFVLICALHLFICTCSDGSADRTPTDDSGVQGDSLIPGSDGSVPGDGPSHDLSLADGANEATPPTDGAADAAPGDAAQSDAGTAADWILNHFAGDPVMSGDFNSRTTVEAPHLVMNATGTNAKYAFDCRDESAPTINEVGFIDVTITDLVSSDAWGGGIITYTDGMTLFLSNIYVEPNWPMWQDYSTTNKDGIVLDGASAFYAEDLTIKNFNADSGIDNKAMVSQMVRLNIDSPGHRSLRYWRDGPHYLVDSSINNSGTAGDGDLIWMNNCSTTTLNVYNSTFNGSSTIPANKIYCENGSSPQITYLTTDPRTTGEMHPMFVAP